MIHPNQETTDNSKNNHSQAEIMLALAWDSSLVCSDLQKSCAILNERCLKLAAKWAAEQWMGLPSDVISSNAAIPNVANSPSTISDELEWNKCAQNKNNPGLHYARTLLELGEYAHAAAVLSQTATTKAASEVEHGMMPPIPNLTKAALYLRAYALFLAGERRKEEDRLVDEGSADNSSIGNSNPTSNPSKSSFVSNPFLKQLSQELLEAYHKDQLDAFGLYVYGMVLKAASFSGKHYLKTVLPPESPAAHSVLIQSILQFPYNWSAWLDLADIVVNGESSYSTIDFQAAELEEEVLGHCNQRRVERDIEDYLQPELGGHFMYHFFCAHLQAERQAHSEALVIYERWMDPSLFQGSPYLLSQYAICSYHTRQFAAAKSLLEDLHNHMPYRLDNMDVYSNILYVQEDSVALSQLAHTAVLVDKYRAETCCIVGNYYSLKQQRAKAIQYFQRALKMDHSYTSAWTLMGHEFVEWKQTANAMQAYRRAVQVAPGDYRAWYGLGQTYELLNMNLYALYYYKQATQLRPFDARMWCAVGSAYANLQRTDDAIRAYERALEQDDSEGIATQKLAALYRQQEGYEEKAAACYWRHLEIRYLVTNSAERSPTSREASEPLEKMLQAISIETLEAEALLYLANYHRKNIEYDVAAVFCSRLLEYPGPEKEDAKALLRELRSRTKPAAVPYSQKTKSGLVDVFEFSP